MISHWSPNKFQHILCACAAISTLMILGWVLKYSAYGIDFTDEAFYLVWISNPFAYDISLTQFGFIYHPLYLLLSGDITALRQVNALITFALGWGLSCLLLKTLVPSLNTQRMTLMVASAAIACCALLSLGFYQWFLPTPSYNSLTLQALLITSTGWILADRLNTFKSTAGWILIGIGGWLTFMAKPSSALALAVGVFAYLWFTRKLSFKGVALVSGTALAMLLISALWIDGSVPGFFTRLLSAMESSSALGGGHSLREIFRIDGVELNNSIKIAMIFLGAGGYIFLRWNLSSTRSGIAASVAGTCAAFVLVALMALGIIARVPALGYGQNLLILSLVLSLVTLGFLSGHKKSWKNISARHWATACFFMAMPHIYAFGTNGNYWYSGGAAAIFWLLAGITLFSPMTREKEAGSVLMPLALLTQTLTMMLLHAYAAHPYRQPQPLQLNTSFVTFGAQRSHLIVSAAWHKYIENARILSSDAGFTAGTPIIDMSGRSPGILYMLGAKNLGQAWNIGGYPGSLARAMAAFNRVSCEEISSAWILLEPNGPIQMPIELLTTLGIDFPMHYRLVAQWETAPGAGEYQDSFSQLLYAPNTAQKIYAACLANRELQSP